MTTLASSLAAVAPIVLVLLLSGCTKAPQDLSANDPGHQPGSIDGHVVDTSGLPVADANVTLLGTKVSVVTDGSGGFRFDAVAPGNVVLVASKPGFSTGTARGTVGEGAALDLEILLVDAPMDEPRQRTLDFQGLIPCGLPAGTGCGPLVTGELPRHHFEVEPGLDAMLFELVWTSPGPGITQELRMDVAAATESQCGQMHATVTGPSELRLRTGTGFPVAGGHQCALVLPGDDLVVQQSYRLFVTLFYHGPGDPDFTAVPS